MWPEDARGSWDFAICLSDLPVYRGGRLIGADASAGRGVALVITTLWILADSVGFWRLLLLMVSAMVAMVVWLIVAHHLWERPESPEKRKWTVLYNGVTILTRGVAVLLAYAVLFALIFVAAWVFVPGAYFQTILKHPVGFGEYLTLVWLAASLATVAGALGSSLEDEETVARPPTATARDSATRPMTPMTTRVRREDRIRQKSRPKRSDDGAGFETGGIGQLRSPETKFIEATRPREKR